MHLLVSVADGVDAAAALDGGADIIDAKDPLAGALGAVTLDVFREIREAVGSGRPVTAAVGGAASESDAERTSFAFAAAGARFVKVDVGAPAIDMRATALAAAARRGVVAGGGGASALVLVAYADRDRTRDGPAMLIDLAFRVGARGVLLDTADKNGPGLRALVASHDLAAWIAHAHMRSLFVAVAGRLAAEDLTFASDAGADIAGVRGAACEGGRTGRVSAVRVRDLRERLPTGAPSVTALNAVRARGPGFDRLPSFDASQHR
ncbi:MAG TPA: (5-formylfuran-3-yl)methyl phosphate synthase [Vicinamibacterales bacterium]|nr:(5-formylfuran-3-yl)methyl phosphate synthase [Vicinamibacterales bacterium]